MIDLDQTDHVYLILACAIENRCEDHMKTKISLCRVSALALAVFTLVGATPIAAQSGPTPMAKLPISDIPYEQITSFEQVRVNWVRRAQEGNLRRDYAVQVIQEWPAAAPAFTPEPGGVYVYENTGRSSHADRPPEEKNTNRSNRVVVLDAKTRQVIASNEMAPELAGPILTAPEGSKDPAPAGQGSIIKVDALSLQPLKLMNIGGSLHHAAVLQDRYVLMDNFSVRREDNALDVMLFDPETDTIVGGVRDEELGGKVYTAWADPTGDYVYILMEPTGYDGATQGAAGRMRADDLRWARPFWVAKLRLSDWSIEREYPYPGYRSDWVQFSADGKSFFVNGAGDDKLIKIDIETGEVIWSQATGPGPYGIEVNGDGTQVWSADKGESAGMFGRTVTVVNTETGKHISTLPGAYQVDHIVLSPNGREMWATSNGEGKLWVYDSDNRKLLDIINMPGFGDAHGLVFVAYDANGSAKVVADQGDFHAGIDPRNGKPLSY
jgi:DNA-binding beta-propeller fold protein YncE